MRRDLTELTRLLQQLCDQAAHETDPHKQDELTQEIYRVLEEKQKLRSSPSSIPEMPRDEPQAR